MIRRGEKPRPDDFERARKTSREPSFSWMMCVPVRPPFQITTSAARSGFASISDLTRP
jgi:hypothetical protein